MSRPDLSALPREVRVRIAVAETQGARWDAGPAGLPWRWQFLLRDADGTIAVEIGSEEHLVWSLPAYLTDPAAWGALLAKERIAVSPNLAGGWQSSWSGSGALFASPNLQPGEVICAAILAKHNVDWTTLEPVG